jgi:hypothetical protein
MNTYGAIYADGRQELVSIVLDENDEPRLDTLAPYPTPEDWVAPQIIPLVKLDPPADGQHYEPTLVWFPDRVERQWVAAPPPPAPPAPLYTAEEWLDHQGYGGNRPTTLLYQKLRLDAAAKSSPKLDAVQSWLDTIIALRPRPRHRRLAPRPAQFRRRPHRDPHPPRRLTMHDHHALKTLGTGLLGTGTTLGAAAYSLLPHLETWLRLTSLTIGLLVGLATLIKLLRDLRK